MTRPLRVLLVEDSERDAALLALYLRRAGYEATLERVETGPEMQSRLDASDWDVVISDLNLPNFDAPAALELVRHSGRNIPFIVLSGAIDEVVAKKIISAGAMKYLVKGQMKQVMAAIEEAVRTRS